MTWLLENASPSTFYVVRFFSSTPLNPDNLPAEVRIRPVVSEADAEAIARSDALRYAGVWVQVASRMEYFSEQTQGLMVYGADNSFMEANGGQFAADELIPTDATDFSPYLLKVRQAKPDVVCCNLAGNQVTNLIKQYAEFGLPYEFPERVLQSAEQIPDEISKKIFLIRGHRVMLDVDLANL